MMKSDVWKNSTSFFSARGFGWAWFSILLLVAFCLLGLCGGCSVMLPKIKSYEEAAREVEARGPLVSAPVEQREGYEEGKSEPIQRDQAAPYSGILMDEKKATRLAAIKAERDRRRAELEAITKKAEIQKLIYESTVEHLKAKLEAKASWWERYKLFVGFGVGTVLGMAIVTGLTYGLTRGKGIDTGSSSQKLINFSRF
jgi:hypothetical protein